jgi:hypothetical protein
MQTPANIAAPEIIMTNWNTFAHFDHESSPTFQKFVKEHPAAPQGDYYKFFEGDEEKNFQFFSSSPSKNL